MNEMKLGGRATGSSRSALQLVAQHPGIAQVSVSSPPSWRNLEAVGERRILEPQVGLVDQSRGVERVARRLARDPGGGQPAQLVIHEREEPVVGRGVAHRSSASGPGVALAASSLARSAFHAFTSSVLPAASPAATRSSQSGSARSFWPEI